MPRTVPNTDARLRAASSSPALADNQILFMFSSSWKMDYALRRRQQRSVSQLEFRGERRLHRGEDTGRGRGWLPGIPGFRRAQRCHAAKGKLRCSQRQSRAEHKIRGHQHLAFAGLAAGHRARLHSRHLHTMLAVHAVRLLSRRLPVMMTWDRAVARVAAGSARTPCGCDQRSMQEQDCEQRNTGLGSAPAILPEEVHHPIRSPNIAQSPRRSHTKRLKIKTTSR